MEFDNARIDRIVQRLPVLLPSLHNEEATKASLVTPFIAALGYDVHDPLEVQREFGADAGRGGEAVDYAIMDPEKPGVPIILIEAKHHETVLRETHERQLRRYFNATPECRVGIVTNGVAYKVFSDIKAQNFMDDSPFCEWNMAALSPAARESMRGLAKQEFSVKAVTESAEEKHYGTLLHEMLRQQMNEPDPSFVRWWGKQVYEGKWMPRIADRFTEITKSVMREFVGREVQSALAKVTTAGDERADSPTPADEVVTTETELRGFAIIRQVLAGQPYADRVVLKDYKHYAIVGLNDRNGRNGAANRIARLYFNDENELRVGIVNGELRGGNVSGGQWQENRHRLGGGVEELWRHSAELRRAADIVSERMGEWEITAAQSSPWSPYQPQESAS